MTRNRLRVYYGPDEDQLEAKAATNTVTVQLGEVLPLLADAARQGRAWIDDFCDDEVTISSDLYEVLLAYKHLRRPSA